MLKLYGTTWCQDCQRVKGFLGAREIDYEWIDVAKINKGCQVVPTLVFDDGSVLVEPTNEELAEKLKLEEEKESLFRDLIIVGAGPAGLTAAIYTAREGINPLLIEKGAVGGQAATTWTIENYPGFPEPITGQDFAKRLREQALEYGSEINFPSEVKEIKREGKYITVVTDERIYHAKAVLLATGATYRRLNLPNEEKLLGKGVHYCATCDGAFYKDKTLAVVGGGNAAAEESLFLTKFASRITILVRNNKMIAEKLTQEKVQAHPKIELRFNTEVREIIEKEGKFAGVKIINNQTNEQSELRCDGMFVFIGMIPASGFVKGTIELNKWGYIETDKTLETNIPGIFAAGDVRAGSTKQIASAVGEGATAALMLREYLREH